MECKAIDYPNIFYYGVANTPLVFRLGYKFGQTKKVRFLHRFRPNEEDQEFVILPEHDETCHKTFDDVRRIENKEGHRSELIVAISTTFEIKDSDIDILDRNDEKLRYVFKADPETMGFDYFSSMQKIKSYTNSLIKDIRKLVKNYNISTIHILMSSSVPFTFHFAQQMNTQQFPKIIVYQYENQKYSWGIDVTENDAEKAVVRLNDNVSVLQM